MIFYHKRVGTVLVALLTVGIATYYYAAPLPTTEVPDICELASLQIVDTQTIRARVRRGGPCSGYIIGKSDIHFPEPNDEIYVRQGESFITVEKDISNEYKFVKIQNSKVLLKVKTRINSTSAGGGIKRTRKQIAVTPFSRMYGDREIEIPITLEKDVKKICNGSKQDTQR